MLTSHYAAMLHAAGGSPPLQAIIIVIGTFILEDAATLLAAMQVASGAVLLPLALGALYGGIIMGDLGLYGLGRLSGANRWAQRLVPARRQDLGRDWVSQRIVPIVLISRFVPGLRLPTYTTLGFLKAPMIRFALIATVATLLWTSGLFYLCLKLGSLMMHYLGAWRWAGLAVFAAVLLGVGRLGAKLTARKTGKDNSV